MSYKKVLAENRKARHDYEILDSYQTGIELAGTEVKSVRNGKLNLKGSFGLVEHDEIWLYNMHISPYDKGSIYNLDPMRKRKLLLKKTEIKKLIGKTAEKGLVLVPLKVYIRGNWVKVDLALGKSKKQYKKREAIKRKDVDRDVERELSLRRRK